MLPSPVDHHADRHSQCHPQGQQVAGQVETADGGAGDDGNPSHRDDCRCNLGGRKALANGQIGKQGGKQRSGGPDHRDIGNCRQLERCQESRCRRSAHNGHRQPGDAHIGELFLQLAAPGDQCRRQYRGKQSAPENHRPCACICRAGENAGGGKHQGRDRDEHYPDGVLLAGLCRLGGKLHAWVRAGWIRMQA